MSSMFILCGVSGTPFPQVGPLVWCLIAHRKNVLPRMTPGPEQDSVEAVLESVCKCSIQNQATYNNISVRLFHTFRIQEDCFVSVSSLSWDPVASYDDCFLWLDVQHAPLPCLLATLGQWAVRT